MNMDCRLELKTIALHARNAEYNPKVRVSFLWRIAFGLLHDCVVYIYSLDVL